MVADAGQFAGWQSREGDEASSEDESTCRVILRETSLSSLADGSRPRTDSVPSPSTKTAPPSPTRKRLLPSTRSQDSRTSSTRSLAEALQTDQFQEEDSPALQRSETLDMSAAPLMGRIGTALSVDSVDSLDAVAAKESELVEKRLLASAELRGHLRDCCNEILDSVEQLLQQAGKEIDGVRALLSVQVQAAVKCCLRGAVRITREDAAAHVVIEKQQAAVGGPGAGLEQAKGMQELEALKSLTHRLRSENAGLRRQLTRALKAPLSGAANYVGITTAGSRTARAGTVVTELVPRQPPGPRTGRPGSAVVDRMGSNGSGSPELAAEPAAVHGTWASLAAPGTVTAVNSGPTPEAPGGLDEGQPAPPSEPPRRSTGPMRPSARNLFQTAQGCLQSVGRASLLADLDSRLECGSDFYRQTSLADNADMSTATPVPIARPARPTAAVSEGTCLIKSEQKDAGYIPSQRDLLWKRCGGSKSRHDYNSANELNKAFLKRPQANALLRQLCLTSQPTPEGAAVAAWSKEPHLFEPEDARPLTSRSDLAVCTQPTLPLIVPSTSFTHWKSATENTLPTFDSATSPTNKANY